MRQFIYLIFLGSLCCMASCNKFLEEKSNKASTVPSTLEDMQALLDAGNQLNMGSYPYFIETCTDDYFLSDEGYNKMDAFDKQVYTFQNPESYNTIAKLALWRNAYKAIAVANTVLDGLAAVEKLKGLDRNNIKGQALFHRAFMHFILTQVYCAPFDQKGDNILPGIPLKLTSDINDKTARSTVKTCYEVIIDDLVNAAALLSNEVAVVTRPNKVAAYAALSRVYLAMEDYENAKKYAESALNLYNKLLDLNTMDLTVAAPFQAMNAETLFFGYSNGSSMFNGSSGSYINEELLHLYEAHDLRLTANFKKETNGFYSFKGQYTGAGSYIFFVGLTTSEMLLNAAEGNVRLGNTSNALKQLNKLLQNRIEKSFFAPVTETDAEALLELILQERRKELIRRSVRWSDLRRLNKDERFKKKIVRRVTIDGKVQEFRLEPNSNNYIFNTPIEVINMTGMQ